MSLFHQSTHRRSIGSWFIGTPLIEMLVVCLCSGLIAFVCLGLFLIGTENVMCINLLVLADNWVAGFTAYIWTYLELQSFSAMQFSFFPPKQSCILMLIIIDRLYVADYSTITFLLLFSEWTVYTWTWLPSPSQAPLPYARRDAPLMCRSELRTAGWEVGCTLGAPKARQDQATERKETFLCIHEYHSSERERRTKTTEVNDFSVSSSVLLCLLCSLVVAAR